MCSVEELNKRIAELEKELENSKKANEALLECLRQENEELTHTVHVLDVDVKRLTDENRALQDQLQELQHRFDKTRPASQGQASDESSAAEIKDLSSLWRVPVFSLSEQPVAGFCGSCHGRDYESEAKALLDSLDTKENADLLTAFDLITHRNKPITNLVNLLGADVDRCLGVREMTPLMYACYFGNLFAYEALLHAGARAGLRGAGDNTLLHFAAMSGESMLALSIAMTHAKMHEARNSDGETPLHIAVRSGHRDIVRFLAKDKFDATKVVTSTDGATPLHYAAALGDVECARMLLDRFSGIADANGNTALHAAVSPLPKTAESMDSLLDGRAKVVELFLQSGKFDVNAKNKDGSAPLQLASVLGSSKLIELLSKSQA